MATSGRAQVAVEHDDVHDRLDAARADIARIQAEADSIEEQIASIDNQAAAVAEALEVSRELATRAHVKIAFLERDLARKEHIYRRVRQRVEDVAESLYRNGPAAELGLLLSAASIDELNSLLEYSSAATQDRIQIMVKTRRLEVELDADRAELEVILAQALQASEEQERQAQHLKELRQAQTAKLADVRDEIESSREEAAAIQARSEEIAQQLDAKAPASALLSQHPPLPPLNPPLPPRGEFRISRGRSTAPSPRALGLGGVEPTRVSTSTASQATLSEPPSPARSLPPRMTAATGITSSSTMALDSRVCMRTTRRSALVADKPSPKVK